MAPPTCSGDRTSNLREWLSAIAGGFALTVLAVIAIFVSTAFGGCTWGDEPQITPTCTTTADCGEGEVCNSQNLCLIPGATGAPGQDGQDGAQGPRGPQGETGTPGVNGTGCEVETDENGCAVIVCASSTSAPICPGVNGENGQDGIDGTGCWADRTGGCVWIFCGESYAMLCDGASGTNGTSFKPCPTQHICGTDEVCSSNGVCVPKPTTTECTPGTFSYESCGLNGWGSRERVCRLDGTWGSWSVCSEQGTCLEGSSQSGVCGLNGRGVQYRTCLGGMWMGWGNCIDSDQCVDNALEVVACGPDGQGTQMRHCLSGQWAYDVCWTHPVPECVTDADCDDDNAGTQDRCVQGECVYTPTEVMVTIKVTSPQLAEAHVYYGYDRDDYGNTPYVLEIPKADACVWGAEVDLRVAQSINPTMPWYNCDTSAPTFDGVRIYVDGTEISWTIVHHLHECGGNLRVTRAQFGCD